MFSAILSFFTGLLGKMIGNFFGKKPAEPTVASLSAEKGALQQTVVVQEKANEVTTTAAAARSDAELSVVRAVTEAPTPTAPATNDKLAEQFPDLFRD